MKTKTIYPSGWPDSGSTRPTTRWSWSWIVTAPPLALWIAAIALAAAVLCFASWCRGDGIVVMPSGSEVTEAGGTSDLDSRHLDSISGTAGETNERSPYRNSEVQ